MARPVVAIIGCSGSGKTWFIENLIPELRARGFTVAYVKHCHKGFELDHPTKDSGRAARAGAETVVLASEDETARIDKRRVRLSDLVGELVEGADIILAEGFKSEHVRKVEVIGPGERALCDSDPDLIAVISDEKAGRQVPAFGTRDIKAFADFLGREIMSKEKSESEVILEVDGSPVDLNDFVKSMVSSAVIAMITNLRGVEEPRDIKLTIRRTKGGDTR